MNETRFEITLLSESGETTAILDGIAVVALRYERILNDVSTAQFTISAQDERAEEISKHRFFVVTRYGATVTDEGSFLVAYTNRYRDEDGLEWLIVSGVSPEYFLLQRVLDIRNDSSAAGGYSTKLGPVDSVMAEIATEQIGPGASEHGSTPSQQIPGLSVATAAGTGVVVPFRDSWSSLLSVMQSLASGDRMDFRIVRTAGIALEFRAEMIGDDFTRTSNYPGQRFVVISPELGTMKNPSLVRDWREEKTVVILLGKGAGDYREFYGSMSLAADDTPYSVSVIVEDIRESDDATEYIEQATETLNGNRAKTEFSFEVDRAYNDYQTLWHLGDFVTVRWHDFEDDMRITSVMVDVDQGGESISLKVRGKYDE